FSLQKMPEGNEKPGGGVPVVSNELDVFGGLADAEGGDGADQGSRGGCLAPAQCAARVMSNPMKPSASCHDSFFSFSSCPKPRRCRSPLRSRLPPHRQ